MGLGMQNINRMNKISLLFIYFYLENRLHFVWNQAYPQSRVKANRQYKDKKIFWEITGILVVFCNIYFKDEETL